MTRYGNHNRPMRTSAYQEPGFPQYPYQAGGEVIGGGPYPVPYEQQAAPPAKSGGSGFKLDEIKSFVDRMGGIDGILDTMGKVNRFMQTMQQMGPMFKLLLGSFGGAKAATAKTSRPPSRRRRSSSNRSRRSSAQRRRRR